MTPLGRVLSFPTRRRVRRIKVQIVRLLKPEKPLGLHEVVIVHYHGLALDGTVAPGLYGCSLLIICA
jgi:hypothetical protein